MSTAVVTPPPIPVPAAAPPSPAPPAPARPPQTFKYKLPLRALQAGFRRFTVDEYHKMIDVGVLKEGEKVELINGYLVQKMSRNPPHDSTIDCLTDFLTDLRPDGWRVRIQLGITLSASEPEPDGVLARGDARTFRTRHPGPADIGLVIEVADSTLDSDRADKLEVYAEAGLPVYWVVNIPDRQVEVYTHPSGPGEAPGYAARQDYRPGDSVPVVLDGTAVGTVAVADLLP